MVASAHSARGFGLEAALVEDRELRPRRREAVRPPRVACELHGFAGALEGLIRVAQEPERERRPRVAGDAGVVAQGSREGVVVALLAGKQGHSSLRLLERMGEGALVEEAAGQQLGYFEPSSGRRVRDLAQERLRGFLGSTELAADLVDRAEREEHRSERLVVLELLAEGARPHERLLGPRGRPALDAHQRLAEERLELELEPVAVTRHGERRERVERPLDMLDRLGVRIAPERPLGGEP